MSDAQDILQEDELAQEYAEEADYEAEETEETTSLTEDEEEELEDSTEGALEEFPSPADESSPHKNLWDDPDFPKTGWECVGMSDNGQDRAICELCGQQNVRYAHHMRHPEYGDLTVGCICAGKMEGDIEAAKQREREFKRKHPEEALPLVPSVPYHERYYLRYRDGLHTAPQDTKGTIAFLQTLGFDGGELKQAREGKEHSESFKSVNKNKNNQMFCSYCRTEISGVDFYRLPDGRLRCNACSSTLIKTKAEVEEIFQRVIDNLDNFFGATIDVPVSVQVLEEKKLRKIRGFFGKRDSQSVLVRGVTIKKKKNFSILVENGAPSISLIATFAHELTHIWQYTHWDSKKGFKKCQKKKRLSIYEGMAKWAEIQYLYLVGKTSVAKREEAATRVRQDEYGKGFCLYEDHYPLTREAMTCEYTPFIPDSYPFG